MYANEFGKHISAEELAAMQAYADGVNAYVAQATILPLEFWLTGTSFEPWKVEHSFMIAKLIEFHLSISQVLKSFKTYVAEYVGIDFLKEIVQVSPEYQFLDQIVNVINDEDTKAQNLHAKSPHKAEITRKNIRNSTLPPISLTPPTGMSDSWAVKGEYSKTGKPLLANDPHLTHKLPGVWYYMTLKFPNSTVTGVGLPGLPPVLIGRNDHVAWGFTASGIENIDMYWLDVDVKNKTYYYDKKWVPLNVRKEIIKVKNGKDVEVKCYSTHHGPVVMKTPLEASSIYMFGSTAFMESPYTLNWHGFKPKDAAFTAAYGVMFARNAKEMGSALNSYEVLPAAVIFATVSFRVTLGRRRHRVQGNGQSPRGAQVRRPGAHSKRQSPRGRGEENVE